jgi:hypothetical protein
MKNSFLAVIVGATLAGCGGADTQSVVNEQAQAAVGATICNWGSDDEGNAHANTTYTGNLVVPAGATCRLYWSEVKGNVSVNGNLITIHTTFDRNVGINGGSLKIMNWGSTFLGNLSITNSSGPENGFWSDYSNTVICGNFSYVGNSVPLYTEGDVKVQGSVTYNTSPPASYLPPAGVTGLTECMQ